MNPKLQERLKIFKDSANVNNKDRVCNLGNMWAWPVWEAGASLNEAARDYDLRTKILTKFQEKYNFDFYADLWSRNPMKVSDSLGGGTFTLTDDPFVVATGERDYVVAPEDYDAMIEDILKFLWTKFIPRKLPNLLEGDSLTKLKNATRDMLEYKAWDKEITKIMKEEYGTMCLFAGETEYLAPYADLLVDDLRGMKGLMRDIRRCPDKLAEWLEHFGVFGLDTASREKGSNPGKPADYTMTCLAHTFMNAKQFERFYWPYMKAVLDYAAEYDKVVFCFLEGNNERYHDYLVEAGQGHAVLYMEKDDPFKAKKDFEYKHCTGGGMPSLLMKNGTPQECVDYAKKLIDELAYDGGYVFGQDLMVSYPADCDPDNLLAVNNFVNNYKG